jgi:hypothetical protein
VTEVRSEPRNHLGQPSGRLRALSVLVLSQLTFLPTIRFGLVWDDPMLLEQVGAWPNPAA